MPNHSKTRLQIHVFLLVAEDDSLVAICLAVVGGGEDGDEGGELGLGQGLVHPESSILRLVSTHHTDESIAVEEVGHCL